MISIYISCKNINVYRIFIWNVYSYPFSTVNINFSILPFGIIYRLFTIFSYTLCIICNIFVRRAPKTILIMSIPILFICINLEIYRRQFRDRFCFCCFFSYYTFIPLMTICGTIFYFLLSSLLHKFHNDIHFLLPLYKLVLLSLLFQLTTDEASPQKPQR